MTTKKATKADVLRRVGRSITKSLKAQGYDVTNGAVLNALAAADGSLNWHVFVKKLNQAAEAQSATPRSIWIGVHTHRHGTDLYPALTYEAVLARKRAIALENIEHECPEYKKEGLTTDDEKVSYYWDRLAELELEWFDITEEQLEDEEDVADRPTEKMKPALEIGKILVATTAHVTWEEAQYLDANGYSRGEYGWFLHVGAEDHPVAGIEHPSPGLAGIIETAQRAGCVYLLLDRDADAVEGVPTYDW